MTDLRKKHRPGSGGDGDDTKGDDNKASADPSNIDDLGDEMGTRVGKHEEDQSR